MRQHRGLSLLVLFAISLPLAAASSGDLDPGSRGDAFSDGRPQTEAEKKRVVKREYESLLSLPLVRYNRPESISWNGKGIRHVEAGEYDDAYLCFRKSIELDPTSFVSYKNMGSLLREEGETEYRCRFYERAVSLKPDDTVLRYFLGEAYATAGLYWEAVSQGKILRAAGEDLSDEKWHAQAVREMEKGGEGRRARRASAGTGESDLLDFDGGEYAPREHRISHFQAWSIAVASAGAVAAGTGFIIDGVSYGEYEETDDHDTAVRMHERSEYSRILGYVGVGVTGLGGVLFLVATSIRQDAGEARAGHPQTMLCLVPDPRCPRVACSRRF